jgi:hypothetical protein
MILNKFWIIQKKKLLLSFPTTFFMGLIYEGRNIDGFGYFVVVVVVFFSNKSLSKVFVGEDKCLNIYQLREARKSYIYLFIFRVFCGRCRSSRARQQCAAN